MFVSVGGCGLKAFEKDQRLSPTDSTKDNGGTPGTTYSRVHIIFPGYRQWKKKKSARD
jgi:hypothetical protein